MILRGSVNSENKEKFYAVQGYQRKLTACQCQGRSQDFSKRGSHWAANDIVMAFSPRNIVGCLLKKRLSKGGVTGTPGPP